MTIHSETDIQKGISSQIDILIAEKIGKTYRNRIALEDFSFSLRSGRILGLLGPNGAGKTTAIRILTTILKQTSGSFQIDGYDDNEPQKIRERIGVLPESHGFPKQITAFEYMMYFGRLYGYSDENSQKRANNLLEEVGLKDRQNSLIGSFSRGMRQRLGIARALINNPAVVFLDEPTLGLDPKGQEELLTLVSDIAKVRNSAILLCSHLLSEVERVCDDVIILKSGRIPYSGTVSDIIGQGKAKVVRLRFIENYIPQAIEVLKNLDLVKNVDHSFQMSDWIELELTSQNVNSQNFATNKLLEILINSEIPILKVDTVGTRLHDVFLQLTEEVSV